MLSGQYRFRFYINASHGIYIDGKLGELHPHTWEIILTMMKGQEGFAPFHEIEKLCESSFARYQDGILNEIPPFTTVNPTLENITAVLRDDVRDSLRAGLAAFDHRSERDAVEIVHHPHDVRLYRTKSAGFCRKRRRDSAGARPSVEKKPPYPVVTAIVSLFAFENLCFCIFTGGA